jgi:ferredoxin--NADP+ reductase
LAPIRSDDAAARGFEVSPHIGTPGDYVIERAFVEK